MLKTSEIEKILSYANMPKLENILTPELIMEKNVIYRYYCRGNGLSYIGKCGDRPVIRRWQEHIGALRNNRHGITPTNPNTDYFQHAWNKYGEDSFTIEVIEVTTGELLNEREKYWISYFDSYHNGFNGTEGGDGLTSEVAKISAKKTWSNPVVRAKRVASQNRLEIRAKKSEAMKVSNKKTWSDPKVRAKRSKSMKVSAKIAQNRPEVRAKKSESVKKTWSNPEVKQRHSEAAKIAQNRPEVKAKKSKSAKKTWSDPKIRAKRLKITDKQYIIIAEEYLQGKFNSFSECARFYNVDSNLISDMFNYKYCRKACRNEIIRLCEQYNYPMRGLEVT